jgi:hypothetical protein
MSKDLTTAETELEYDYLDTSKIGSSDVYPGVPGDLPEGAEVTASFRGKVLWREYDRDSSMELELECGTRVVLSWQVTSPDSLEDPAPVIVVHSFGFRPGDVAVRYVQDPEKPKGFRVLETFFATTASTSAREVDWLGKDGVLTDVDPVTLTLVVRDGLPVPAPE